MRIGYSTVFHSLIPRRVLSDVSETGLVTKPSSVDAFTRSAHNAILTSNPTTPLPPEYPDDKAFFTVTFFFNEDPGQ